MRRVFWASCVLVGACQSPTPTPTQPTAVAASSVEVLRAPAIEPEDRAWREHLLVSDYRAAAALFDAQHPAPTEASLRFLRARIAQELGEHARVLELLTGIEANLPSLSAEVLALRRAARIAVAPDLELARALAGSAAVNERLQGAELLLRLSAHDEARAALEGVLGKSKLSTSNAARARRLRAQLLQAKADVSAANVDWLWLSQTAPTEEASKGADDEFERSSGIVLSKEQRYARAEAFAGAGRVDATERELLRMNSAPGPAQRAADVTRTRAWANYNSRQGYAQAAPLFETSANADPRFRVQDLFYAARALSRANQDEKAIERYSALIKRYPDSRFAEEAQFLIARLQQVLGHWQVAADAATTYLTRYPKAPRFGAQARYTRAISWLALSRGKQAERDLVRLLDDTGKARDRALLAELRGVALLQQDKKIEAKAQLLSVIEEQPLSFAALMASTRLVQLGLTPPPALPEAPDANGVSAVGGLPAWELPSKVNFLHGLGLDADAEAELERNAELLAARHAPRGDEVLCNAYGALAPAGARYRHAQRIVRERVLQRAIEPGTRWLWECIYPEPYTEAVLRVASDANVEIELVYAVMRQESAFDPSAGSGVGARGLLQLMPETARRVAIDLGLDPELQTLDRASDNLRLGATYLGKMLQSHASVPLAAAAYNAGPGAVARWLTAAGDLPLDLFVAQIPYRETREYAQRVTGNWARYRYLRGGLERVPELPLSLPARSAVTVAGY